MSAEENRTLSRRTALKAIGASAVASGAVAGVSTATSHCDTTVTAGDSIQDAIDNAVAGDTICVENGTYEETLSNFKDGLTIQGESRAGVTIDASGESGRGIEVDGAEGVTLESFTLIGTPDDYGFKIQFCDDVAVRDITVEQSYRSAVDLNAVTGATIADVEATGTASGVGVALTDTKEAVVDNVTITDNAWGGIALFTSTFADVNRVENVTISDSFCAGSPSGIYLQDTGQTGANAFTDILIEENTFQENILHVAEIDTNNQLKTSVDWIDFSAVLDTNEFDQAATVQDNPIVVPAIFSSIQDAIDAASSGEAVVVEPGTYPENVTVDVENLTLEGPNTGTPGYGSRDDEATIEGRVELTADGTTLDGFDVSPPPAATNQTSEAVRASNTPDDVTIENNTVRDFEREDPDGGFYGVDGINIFGGDGTVPIENATVRGNEVRNLRNEDTGGAAGISIQGNVVGASVADNFVTEIAEKVTAYGFGVTIRGTGNHGEVPENVDVTGNDFNNVLSDPGSQFFGVGVGIEAGGAGYSITYNTIEENDIGTEVKDIGDLAINLNNIVGNGDGAVNQVNQELDATCNWWGHPTGPEHDDNPKNNPKGNSAVGNVDFQPWSTRRIGRGENVENSCVGGKEHNRGNGN